MKTTLEELKEAIRQLIVLKDGNKFFPDLSLIYPGTETEWRRQHLNDYVNQFIDDLIIVLTTENITNDDIRNQFKIGLMRINRLRPDVVDKQRVCQYFDEIRMIIGFENINAMLEKWLKR